MAKIKQCERCGKDRWMEFNVCPFCGTCYKCELPYVSPGVEGPKERCECLRPVRRRKMK